MKIIQLIFRIITSPIIFLLAFAAMVLFPGTILFVMGTGMIIGKALGVETDEPWDELLLMTFSIVIFPFVATYNWIINAKIMDT